MGSRARHAAVRSEDEVSLPDSMLSDGEEKFEVWTLMEVFSVPRIAPVVVARGMRAAPSMDLLNGFNFHDVLARERCYAALGSYKPLVLMLSPCTVFSPLQHSMTHRRRDYAQWATDYDAGLELFRFALALWRKQCMAGRYAVLEHPARASSWALPEVASLLQEFPGAQVYTFDQCLLGLRTLVDQNPVRKRTRFLSNWPRLGQSCFNRVCDATTCNHLPRTHTWLQGSEGNVSRARAAQEYPRDFCSNG